ncbi:hypothetical protein T492DRAFT_284788 [Pavlovales sp. CCMP2436]|nr:hypothetical protein T492DRAFT_284788 [Pavlovales sp. CCMP2436]
MLPAGSRVALFDIILDGSLAADDELVREYVTGGDGEGRRQSGGGGEYVTGGNGGDGEGRRQSGLGGENGRDGKSGESGESGGGETHHKSGADVPAYGGDVQTSGVELALTGFVDIMVQHGVKLVASQKVNFVVVAAVVVLQTFFEGWPLSDCPPIASHYVYCFSTDDI